MDRKTLAALRRCFWSPACVAPFLAVYPVFLMKWLCFALFACAFNLLLGFTGLLSFGHAAFLGSAGYVTGGWCSRSGAGRPSWRCWPARRWPRCSGWSSARWRSGARASTSR